MIFCQCQAVSEKTVREVIREGAATVAEVSARCGAGLSCAPCRNAIGELIVEEHRDEDHRSRRRAEAA